MKLSYLTRARLWADIVGGGDRVFVATTDTPPVGRAVTVELEAPGLNPPLSLRAVVVGHQALDGKLPAGVFVKLDAESHARCLAAVGADRDESTRVLGRSEPRADCELPVRVLKPAPMDATARSLSLHGLTLKTPVALAPGAELALALTLPAQEVLLTGTVQWSRGELLLAGVLLHQTEPSVSAAVGHAIDELLKPAVPTTPAPCVLVADDDPSILEFTSRVVTRAGLRVLRADRGDLALSLIRAERPALCLLDVLMPGLDGLAVCAAIRADASLATTPVVLLSAMGEARLAAAAATAKADGWLTKPMHVEALRELLTRYAKR